MKLTSKGIGLAVAGAALLAGAAGAVLWRAADPSSAGLLQPNDPEIVSLGTEIYSENCAGCHGAALEGQADWQTRRADGRLPAPPHDETGHTWHHSDEVLFEITKYGIQRFGGADYESDMPAFEGVLNDDQIVAVLSFIKSRWPAEIRQRHDRMNEQAEGSGRR